MISICAASTLEITGSPCSMWQTSRCCGSRKLLMEGDLHCSVSLQRHYRGMQPYSLVEHVSRPTLRSLSCRAEDIEGSRRRSCFASLFSSTSQSSSSPLNVQQTSVDCTNRLFRRARSSTDWVIHGIVEIMLWLLHTSPLCRCNGRESTGG
jgi:hypothetical protein